MSTYVLPQVQVFQLFTQMPGSVTQNMNAFIFGPQYQLFRYSVPAEKALIGLGQYNAAASTQYGWPSQPSGSVPDVSYAQLYADNVWAQYAAITTADGAQIPSEDQRNEIRVSAMVLQTANGLVRSGTLYRDVKAGDTVRYSYTDMYDVVQTGTSRVVSLVPDVEPASIGDASPKASNEATQAGTENLDIGTALPYLAAEANTAPFSSSKVFSLDSELGVFPGSISRGVVNDVITVTIAVGGAAGTAQANIQYASGMYQAFAVIIKPYQYADGALYLGNNLWLQFEAGGAEPTTFAAGDIYTVTVAAPFEELTGSDMATGGTYTGSRNTTYQVKVIRGGVFDRMVRMARRAVRPLGQRHEHSA